MPKSVPRESSIQLTLQNPPFHPQSATKVVAKKSATKVVAKKSATKVVAKKAAPKFSLPKVAAKKVAPKKAVPKKAAPKKAAPKKKIALPKVSPPKFSKGTSRKPPPASKGYPSFADKASTIKFGGISGTGVFPGPTGGFAQPDFSDPKVRRAWRSEATAYCLPEVFSSLLPPPSLVYTAYPYN